MLKKNDIGPQAYRDAMAHFAGQVHVVTTDGPAGKRGATVIAACSVSDTPPTVLVCLNRENPKNEPFVANGRFALNTLASHQEPLSVGFSGITGLPITWSSSNTNRATVNNTGLVLGISSGTVTITVFAGGKTGSTTVRVEH